MKRLLALALAAALVAVPLWALATDAAEATQAPAKTIVIRNIENPEDGNGGLLNATYSDGVLLLDYNEEKTKEATLLFTFATTGGKSVFGAGSHGIVTDTDAKGLLDPANEGAKAGNTAELSIRIDPSIKGLTVTLEAEDGLYTTRRVSVLWRKCEVGPPVRVASVWPGSDITIGIGQTQEIEVLLQGYYTDKRTTLAASDISLEDSVAVLGSALRGMQEGTAVVGILNGEGTIIGSINVTVQREESSYAEPPEVETTLYRVVVPTVNVYADDMGEKPRIGTLRLNQLVSVFADEGEWLLLSNGAFVKSEYLIPYEP